MYVVSKSLRCYSCLYCINVFPLPPQENEWQDDWVTFYSQQRLQHQLNMVEKSYGDREAIELWAKLQVNPPPPFDPIRNKTYFTQICMIV